MVEVEGPSTRRSIRRSVSVSGCLLSNLPEVEETRDVAWCKIRVGTTPNVVGDNQSLELGCGDSGNKGSIGARGGHGCGDSLDAAGGDHCIVLFAHGEGHTVQGGEDGRDGGFLQVVTGARRPGRTHVAGRRTWRIPGTKDLEGFASGWTNFREALVWRRRIVTLRARVLFFAVD